MEAPADLVLELPEGVVDLGASTGELCEHGVGYPGDLPSALASRSPSDSEPGRQQVAHLGGGER